MQVNENKNNDYKNFNDMLYFVFCCKKKARQNNDFTDNSLEIEKADIVDSEHGFDLDLEDNRENEQLNNLNDSNSSTAIVNIKNNNMKSTDISNSVDSIDVEDKNHDEFEIIKSKPKTTRSELFN